MASTMPSFWLERSFRKNEHHYFSTKKKALLYFAPPQPKQIHESLIEAHEGSVNQLLFGESDLLLSGDWNGCCP